MNLLDAYVTKVLGEPYLLHNKWFVSIEYDCWGNTAKTELMFTTKAEALLVKVGDTFLT